VCSQLSGNHRVFSNATVYTIFMYSYVDVEYLISGFLNINYCGWNGHATTPQQLYKIWPSKKLLRSSDVKNDNSSVYLYIYYNLRSEEYECVYTSFLI